MKCWGEPNQVETSGRIQQKVRMGLTVVLAVYGFICLRHPENYRLLDSVNLAFHEAGHVFFGLFGEFVGFLGGTLMQLIVPAAFVIYFFRRSDHHSASVVLWWFAQNLWNISVYVGDARSQVLPLLGGGEHDWAYLLGRLNLLDFDQTLGRAIHTIGVVIFFGSIIWGIAAQYHKGDVTASTKAQYRS